MASWIEKVKTQFTITTGDAATYTPLSFNANRSTEYNVAEFNFRNLSGTLVDKRRPMGVVYNLELYFQGANHLDTATAFQNSANNSNPWVIQHPQYGVLNVQAISPVYHDNAEKLLNATKIIVVVRETINKSALIPTDSPVDVITAAQTQVTTGYASYYVNIQPEPTVAVINKMHDDVSGFQNFLNKVSAVDAQINNAINAAYSGAAGAIQNVGGAIGSIQNMINSVTAIDNSIRNRMLYLMGMFDSMITGSLVTLVRSTRNILAQKILWFTETGSIIGAMCANTVTNIAQTDYAYNSQVMEVIEQLTTTYNSYLAVLDSLQTYNGSELDSFIPDFDSLFALDSLVMYTLNNLYFIQANSKQPRVQTLAIPSNVYILAWRIYGLLPDDSTIDRIIQDNDVVGLELLQLEKGRQILYYI